MIILWGYDDTDMLPGSYPHRKYMVCMVWILQLTDIWAAMSTWKDEELCDLFVLLLFPGYCQTIVIGFLFQIDNGKHFDSLHASQETEQVSETILEKEKY